MMTPQGLRYTKTHEWAKQEGADVLVGITAHAQEELRDVVYVELPPVGKAVKQGEPVAVVESVKAAFDIYAPLSGTVARVNETLSKSPQLVNQDCYGTGWFFAITPSQPSELSALMSPDDYTKLIQADAH
ncbi:MAG: glycine cleavage system protein GcvH [Candidatus Omnitrophica bacterium]|nr:glycine cleavage system protein GcvH [Candidatus Omnitrophota bacterium]